MHYGTIKNCDIANGAGVRVTLFVSGCTNHCSGCFQKETWDFRYGKPFTEKTEHEILQMLAPSYIDGLTLLGGEPFEPENQIALLPLIRRIRRELPGKSIWAFTGFLYEDLLQEEHHAHCSVTEELLRQIDVLVDGPFLEEEKQAGLRFRGSQNQRILDLKTTRSTGRLTIWHDPGAGEER